MNRNEFERSRRSLTLSPERQALLKKKMAEVGLTTSDETILPRRDRSKPAPLSYAQQRLWFLHQIAPDNPFYNVPLVMRLNGPIDAHALQQSLTELMRRHEVLRTSFPIVYDLPVQVVEEDFAIPLSFVKLRAEPANKRRAEAERLANLQAKMPFDLQTGPVLRAVLVALSNVEHWLLLTFHHIIIDGWSIGILARELAELYRAATEGKAAALPH